METQKLIRRSLLGLTAAVIAIAVPAVPTMAQFAAGDGFTLFGGVDADFRLPYNLQYNTRRSPRTRLILRMPGDRVERATSDIRITYPDSFDRHSGSFKIDNETGLIDPNSIEVRRGRGTQGTLIPVQEVVWTPEAQSLDIYFLEDIPADTTFTIVISNMRNTNRAIMARFNAEMQYRGDVLRQYAGTWDLLLAYEDR